ncbi:MAG: cysteine desulfurase family protein [Pseudomonadota bacterium]
MTNPVYLDHNATTPLDPRVFAVMEPHFTTIVGNPSSIDHLHGHLASQAVENSRDLVARSIGCKSRDIVFTSGCTESNNLVILGLAAADQTPKHIITSQIEHPAILEPCRRLELAGWSITRVPVNEEGLVDARSVESALRPETALVTIMGANNEVGTIQPLAAIGEICRRHNVPFHSDLAQLAGDGGIDIEALGLSLASFSAHKMYGPKGGGVLYINPRRGGARLAPLLSGGGQERNLRPGTLNTPAIVGMSEAFRLMKIDGARDHERVGALRDELWLRLAENVSDIERNGSSNRLANNLSVSITGVEPLALMRKIRETASVSASSACATGKVETSHVLLAMFGDGPRARRALRLSPGRFTTEADIDRVAKAIIPAIEGLRKFAA